MASHEGAMVVRPMASTDLASLPMSAMALWMALRMARGSTSTRTPWRLVGKLARTILPAILPFLRMADLTEEEPTSRARRVMVFEMMRRSVLGCASGLVRREGNDHADEQLLIRIQNTIGDPPHEILPFGMSQGREF